MKLSQLKPCASCGGKIAPVFYVVRVSLAIVTPAANTTLGLNQMFRGNLALAEVFTSEPHPVKVAGDEDPNLMTELLLCQDCYMSEVNLAVLAEKGEGENDAE